MRVSREGQVHIDRIAKRAFPRAGIAFRTASYIYASPCFFSFASNRVHISSALYISPLWTNSRLYICKRGKAVRDAAARDAEEKWTLRPRTCLVFVSKELSKSYFASFNSVMIIRVGDASSLTDSYLPVQSGKLLSIPLASLDDYAQRNELRRGNERPIQHKNNN